jgi:hypothetical protein
MHINHFDIIAARHLPHFAHQAEVLDNLAVEQQPCIMQQGEILHLRPLAAPEVSTPAKAPILTSSFIPLLSL